METMIKLRCTSTSRSRANFAARHMQAAEYFAAQVVQIEANAGERASEQFAGPAYYHYWCAAVTFAVMALEANIYDIMKASERGEQSPLLGKQVPSGADRWSTLARYELVWNLVTGSKFKKGEGLAQLVAGLIDLRDEVTHAKSEFRDAASVSSRLEERLHRCFKSNPFKTGETFFPDQCVSADSAQWATRTVSEFMRQFAEETGVRLNI